LGKAFCALADPTVALELLARAGGEGRGKRESAYGLQVLSGHCAGPGEVDSVLRWVPDGDATLCHFVFAEAHPEHQTILDGLWILIKDIGPDGYDRQKYEPILEMVEMRESQFVDETWQHVVQKMNPGAESWAPLEEDGEARGRVLRRLRTAETRRVMARALLDKACRLTGNKAPIDGLEEVVLSLAGTFATAIQFYINNLIKIAETGCDFTKKQRGNNLWDMNIAMNVGEHSHVGGAPLTLVTDDNGIHKAASETGNSGRVLRLMDYLDLIEWRFE